MFSKNNKRFNFTSVGINNASPHGFDKSSLRCPPETVIRLTARLSCAQRVCCLLLLRACMKEYETVRVVALCCVFDTSHRAQQANVW